MIYQVFGNKQEDYKKSNKYYEEERIYNYKIECQKCGYTIYRQRYTKNFIHRYKCGKCGGKFKLYKILYK